MLRVFKILYIIGVLKCKGMRGVAYVISLQGPMASGKTTLAKRLEKRGFRVIYENPYPIVEKRKKIEFRHEFKSRVYYESKNVYGSKNKGVSKCERFSRNF